MEEGGGAAQKVKRERMHRVISHDYAVAVNECRAFFEREAKEKSRIKVTRPLERTADCFNISQKSIVEIRRKLESGDAFYDQEQRERSMDVPLAFLPIVREAILDMYVAKEHLTLDSLLLKLVSDQLPCRWTWSRATLHRFLTTKMGYTHGEKPSYYKSLKENVSVAAQRIKYIRQVREYRQHNRRIYYQDETWANKNMTPVNVWLDPEGKGELKVPQGKGERCIISHVGWSGGFVSGAKLIFRGKKSLKDSDYHTEINAVVFLDWIEKRVLPAIPAGSVLVLDRATYHSSLTEESRPAKSTFTKAQFCEWLCARGIVIAGASTVNELMQLTRIELADTCRQHKPEPVYQAAVLAREFGCDVLFLPVGHPELNPIEMVWSQVKRYVASNNKNLSLSEVEQLASVALDGIDAEQRSRYTNHCIGVENKYMEAAEEAQFEL